MTTTTVRVNVAAMRQPFHPCTPDFVRDVCQARCCRSTTDPTGIAVVVQRVEIGRIEAAGGRVDRETLRIEPVGRRCPFQHTETHLCGLHETPAKPFGCRVSPFTINPNNTLIVRNRYRFLPCFKADGAVPVAVAHRASLVALFGDAGAARIVGAVADRADVSLLMTASSSDVEALRHKNEASKARDV